MKLGGWVRLWIVLSVVLGALVSLIAFEGRPTRERIVNGWYQSASSLIAEKVATAENQHLSSYEVRDAYFSGSERENISRLKEFANSPSEQAKLFSVELGHINRSYEQQLDALRRSTTIYWVQALGWWLALSALLFLAGWTVGWIVRGFRGRTP